MLVAVLGVALSGCGDTDETARETTTPAEEPRIRHVPDPAMERPAETGAARPVKIDRLPTAVTLNDTQDRIFIPGMGWLPVEEFWDLYENHPARLPDDLDFQAVHTIRLSLAAQDHDDP